LEEGVATWPCFFADSLNIYKTSVKEIGNYIGLQKLDLDKKFLRHIGVIKEQPKIVNVMSHVINKT
jgi:hypothetical protein